MNQRFGGMLIHKRTKQRYVPEDDNFQGSSLFADLTAFPQSEHTELLMEICLELIAFTFYVSIFFFSLVQIGLG
jgi:hypothetical protein